MRKTSALVLLSLISLLSCAQNIVFSLKDKSGNLWFSVSERGVFRYDGTSFSPFKAQVSPGTFIVSCLYEDKIGNLWFKTNTGGVCKYDGKNFIPFSLPPPDSTIVGREKYWSLIKTPIEVGRMLQDKNGDFWFLTVHHGIYRYKSDRLDSLKSEKSFNEFMLGPAPVCMLETKSGDILVGSWDGTGVHRFNGTVFTPLGGFSDGMIFCMKEDKAGNIWAGTRIGGVDRWDGKFLADGRVSVTNFSDKNGLHSDIPCVFQDSKGNMWFGTNWNNLGERGDAFMYDGKTFTNITGNESILKFTDFCPRSIIEDNNGNIWIGSRKGVLLRYDGKIITNFSREISRSN